MDLGIPYCWIDGCPRPAIAELVHGITEDGDEIVTLVCYEHAQLGAYEQKQEEA